MKTILKHPRLFVGLAALWLMVQLFQLMCGGVLMGSDSDRYIFSAQQLALGGEMAPKAAPYLGYIFTVWLIDQVLGFGLVGVVCFQLGLSVLSVGLAHRLLVREAGHAAAGLFLVLMFGFPDFVQWHRYLLTDSMSASLVLLGSCLIYQAIQTRKLGQYVLTLLVIGLGATVRPNGWLLFIPLIVCVSWVEFKTWKRILAMLLGAVLLILLVMASPQFKASVGAEKPAQQLLEGRVIWGAQETYLQMKPETLASDGYGGVLEYAQMHPIATAELMLKRVFWELVKVRPYYSTLHNIVIAVVLIPVYWLAVLGMVRCRSTLFHLMLAVFVLHMALVAITFADWDGRFFMHAYPTLVLMAAWGFSLGPARMKLFK